MTERNSIEEYLRKSQGESAPVPPPEPNHLGGDFDRPRKVVRYRYSKVRLFLLGLFVLCMLGAFGYGTMMLYERFQSAPEASSDDILSEVGKYVDLPQGEVPTMATVTDLEPLKGEPFFAKAMVGDKVIIFSQARKAILYRPSQKMVIAVSPISN